MNENEVKELEKAAESIAITMIGIYNTTIRKTGSETMAKEMAKTYVIAIFQSQQQDPLRFFFKEQ